MFRNAILSVLACVAFLGSASAANKCVRPDRTVEYTDSICPIGTAGGELQIRSNTIVRTNEDRANETSVQPDAASRRKAVRQSGRIESTDEPCLSNSPDNFATPGQERAMREHSKCLADMAKKSTAPLYFK
jgi:hypothetical protein